MIYYKQKTKIMKKILFAMMVLTISFGAIAQSDGRQGNRLGKEKIAELNLTNEQKEKMKAEKEILKKKLEELRGNTGMSAEDMKKNRLEIMKSHKETMKAILTPEQQDQVKEMKKEMKDEGGKVRGEGRGEGRGQKMKDNFEEIKQDLNLSADQSAKMKTLNEELKNNMQKIRDNTSLTQEQKKEQVKALMSSHKTSVDAILTAEQKTKLDAIRKEKGGRKGRN